MSTERSVVVVGAGLAAAHTVETLRSGGYEGRVTLIGDEQTPPYERPPLSKDYLQGKQDREKAIVHDAAWYKDNGIDGRWGETASSIDRKARTVQLESGEDIPYETLVLATGANSRRLDLPGADTAGVHALRRFPESDALREAFRPGGRLAIVGAGWIGLEVAASARQAGMDVTVAAPGAVPLQNVMGEQIGEYFANLHRSNGVELRMGTTVTGILEKDGAAAGLATDAGDIDADMVLAAVGAVPATTLAEAAGLEVDNGVVVDAQLRTSDPNILAIGDVANAENTRLGRLRVEHWDNAIRQGKLAAQVILGQEKSYDWLPYFFTDQFDLGMEYVGHASRGARSVVRGSTESGEFIVFWLEGETVTAAMNVNIWDVNDQLRGIVGTQQDARRLADTGIELTDL